jgi:type IV pilus assembly protein PilV
VDGQRRSRRLRQQGFSLIEVLVALVVLSLGLLGMARMQVLALQGSRDARLMSSAVLLAREWADMVRANAAAATAPDRPYWGDFSAPLSQQSAADCLSLRGSGVCDSAEALARAQMADWLARVDSALPGARVRICLDQTPYDSAGLPQWACSGSGDVVAIKMGWTPNFPDVNANVPVPARQAERPAVIVTLTEGPM